MAEKDDFHDALKELVEIVDMLRGDVIAHSVLVKMLILKVENEPEFVTRAYRLLDTALGMRAATGEPPEAFEIRAREYLARILGPVPELAAPSQSEAPKTRTLRRRFLNWLERG